MLILRLLFGVRLAHYSIGENWILPFSAIMPFSNRITHRAHFHNFWENIQIWSNFTDCVKKTHEKPNLLFYSTQSHKFHHKISFTKRMKSRDIFPSQNSGLNQSRHFVFFMTQKPNLLGQNVIRPEDHC